MGDGGEKTALITGVTGQDGHFAARLLRGKGYRVVGTSRAGRTPPDLDIEVVAWDLTDQATIEAILGHYRPAEIYNFAAYSSGAGMFDRPVDIGDINGLAVARLLEAIRKVTPHARFCQASSSELFGDAVSSPQKEDTPFNPRSPYGAAKLYAHSMINIYRARYGIFACSAILFNHESPLRGSGFVTRKVANAAARAGAGLLKTVSLGNLDARRDWGFAGDTVEAMWRMLQTDEAGDYVVATGVTHSVRALCACAFGHVGLDYRDFVVEDPDAFRSEEPAQLVGDASKAATVLGWKPSVGFEALIQMIVDAELAVLQVEKNGRAPD